MKKLLLLKKFFPEYSLLGFKVLDRRTSIYVSYLFILLEHFITPFFGIRDNQIMAGSFFILLLNLSLIILILNSIVRIRNIDLYFVLFQVPLILYIQILLNKIYLSINYLFDLFN